VSVDASGVGMHAYALPSLLLLLFKAVRGASARQYPTKSRSSFQETRQREEIAAAEGREGKETPEKAEEGKGQTCQPRPFFSSFAYLWG
jgi:hypothetical protein